MGASLLTPSEASPQAGARLGAARAQQSLGRSITASGDQTLSASTAAGRELKHPRKRGASLMGLLAIICEESPQAGARRAPLAVYSLGGGSIPASGADSPIFGQCSREPKHPRMQGLTGQIMSCTQVL